MDFESELTLHEAIDRIVDRLVGQIEEMAEEAGHTELPVSELDKSYIKQYAKELIPGKPPLVAALLSQVLRLMVQLNKAHFMLEEMKNNPDKVDDMFQELLQSEDAQTVINKMDEHQEKLAAKYKNMKINGHQLKVADLGDVVPEGTISLN